MNPPPVMSKPSRWKFSPLSGDGESRCTLFTLALTIGLVGLAIMLWLNTAKQLGLDLPFWLETALNTASFAVMATLLFWFAYAKTLYRQLEERTKIEREAQMRARTLGDRLQWLLDASPSVIYAHETPNDLTQCTFISGNAFNVFGYSPEAMLEDRDFWLNHLHPSDSAHALAHRERLLETGQSTMKYRFLSMSGEYLWICDNARLVRDELGAIRTIVGSWTDITSTKTMGQELVRLRMAAEASADMILLTDAEGSIEYANPAFCRFTGWDGGQVLGNKPWVLKSGKTPLAIYQSLHETLQRGEAWRGRLLNRRRKGALPPEKQLKENPFPGQSDALLYWADVSITPIRDETGINLGYVSIQRDISEAVAREERLALARLDTTARLEIAEILNQPLPLTERFARILDKLFVLSDLSLQQKGGIFLRDNRSDQMETYLLRGRFSDERIRRHQQIPPGVRLCGHKTVPAEVQICDDCHCDLCPEPRFESENPHGHYLIPLSSGGDVLGVMFLFTELHPNHTGDRLGMLKQVGESMGLAILQEQACQALERARDSALDASRLKSEFLANMSHEIRTPMNGVLGMLELLRRTPLSSEQREFAETATHSAETLLAIINGILDFSKIEAGKLELDSVNFDLRVLVEEVCTLLASPAHGKGVELACFVEPSLPADLRGDPTRLRQVLTNLIGNAIKFTERGEVSVETVCLSQDERRAVLRFTVKDTGIGISPEDQKRLFNPFEQADAATTRRFGGTGLGLAIAMNLVMRMGGEIHVESEPGTGATFWFTVDLEKQHPGAVRRLPKVLSRRRVLIVDDNATNRTILNRFLDDWGASSSVAEHAPQALEMLRLAHRQGTPYELVILDLQMPDMDGLMLAQAMNQEPALKPIPRILLSSGGSASESQRAEAGIRQALTKPVRQSQLFDAVVSSLDGDWHKPHDADSQALEKLPQFPGRRVLLVDDNPLNQKVALKMLERFNLIMDLAGNGREALAKLEANHYDLVLMDCQMPQMDGYAATQALRAREKAQGAPRTTVVALTANALSGDREKCLQSGMDDHLAKPFLLDELAHILTHWLKPCAATAAPLWDEPAALHRLGGDLELLAQLKSLFIEEAAKHLDALHREETWQTPNLAADTAHVLKSMVGHLCAQPVMELAIALEQRAKAGDIHRADPLTLQLAIELEKLLEALKTP
ncbi:MAG: response regulator [Methylococcaceae bacterium]|nr:response regulator [Methylococcaceae bacterium]